MSRGRTVAAIILLVLAGGVFVALDPLGMVRARSSAKTEAPPREGTDRSDPKTIAEPTTDEAVPETTTRKPPRAPPQTQAAEEAAEATEATTTALKPRKVATAALATSVPTDVPGGPDLDGEDSKLNAKCFRRRLNWRPAQCSRLGLFLKQYIDKEPAKAYRFLHVGNNDGSYHIASLFDAVSPHHPLGTVALGRSRFANAVSSEGGLKSAVNLAGGNMFDIYAPLCGKCCECVTHAPSLEPQMALLKQFQVKAAGVIPEEHRAMHFFKNQTGKALRWYDFPRTSPLVPSDCTPQRDAFGAAIDQLKTIHVMSFDSGVCDVQLVELLMQRLAMPSPTVKKPLLLQFTAVDSTANYRALVAALGKHKIHCGWFTQLNKVPRGVRASNAPLFAFATACWRGAFNSFVDSRYFLSCWDSEDEVMQGIVEGWAGTTIKGPPDYGCGRHQNGRLRDLDAELLPNRKDNK